MSNTVAAARPSVLLLAMVAGSKPAMSAAVSIVMVPPGWMSAEGAVDGEDVTCVIPPLTFKRFVWAFGAAVAALVVVTDVFLAVVAVAARAVVVAPGAVVVGVVPIWSPDAPVAATVVVVASDGTPVATAD